VALSKSTARRPPRLVEAAGSLTFSEALCGLDRRAPLKRRLFHLPSDSSLFVQVFILQKSGNCSQLRKPGGRSGDAAGLTKGVRGMKRSTLFAFVVCAAVAAAPAGSAVAASTPNLTIQNAVLISPFDVLVTGTSSCSSVSVTLAQVTEENGASGMGSFPAPSNSSRWAVTVTGGAPFVKAKATVSVTTSCGSDTRTISVN
jgi:hypothetical protein